MFLLALTLILACNKKDGIPKYFDYGKIENKIYNNPYFGMNFQIPEKWEVLPNKLIEKITEKGKENIYGNSKDEEYKKANVNTAKLLTMLKHPLEYNKGYNASLLMFAENIVKTNITSGKDYLQRSKEHMVGNDKMKITFLSPNIESILIDKQELFSFTTKLEIGDKSVYQTYYTFVKKGFALTMVIGYDNDEDKKELQALINKTTFIK